MFLPELDGQAARFIDGPLDLPLQHGERVNTMLGKGLQLGRVLFEGAPFGFSCSKAKGTPPLWGPLTCDKAACFACLGSPARWPLVPIGLYSSYVPPSLGL